MTISVLLAQIPTLDCTALSAENEKAIHAFSRANECDASDNFVEAIKWFSVAIKEAPTEFLYYSCRGKDYARVGERNASLSDHAQAIKLSPQNPFSYFERAESERILGLNRQAIADYTLSVNLRGKAPTIFEGRGISLFLTGKYRESIADFDTSLMNGESPNAYFYRGKAKAAVGDYVGAVRDLRSAKGLALKLSKRECPAPYRAYRRLPALADVELSRLELRNRN